MTDLIASELKLEEREAFVAATDTGLWDVLLASVTLPFAVAPLLSARLGDYWSSAVFVPFWIAIYFLVRYVREKFVAPRVGHAQWGAFRRSRLKRLMIAMLAVNIVAFGIGWLAYVNAEQGANEIWAFPITFSLIVLVLLSLAAYAVSIPRFFFYGLLLALCPLLGEVLFRQGIASHHGFPIVFGAASILIAAIGVTKLVRLITGTPRAPDLAL
jgi:hypothetical protein